MSNVPFCYRADCFCHIPNTNPRERFVKKIYWAYSDPDFAVILNTELNTLLEKIAGEAEHILRKSSFKANEIPDLIRKYIQ